MASDLTDKRIAVVHEHYYERGGAERVVEELARTFDAPIYTGFINERALPPEDQREGLTFVDLFGDRTLSPLIRRSPMIRDFYYQFAWQRLPQLTEYDVVIQSGNNPGWYVPLDEQVVVRYVHTPPRTAYDLFHERADSWLTKLYAYASRVLYHPNIHYPDAYVANSELVARRLERYWGIDDPAVVYPPIDIDDFRNGTHDGPYVTYSRLSPDKRIDDIIRAFREFPDERLVVGGAGPHEETLRDLAADMDNVDFRGYLDDAERRELLASAKALVYAAVNEDFGMVPIEAYASGTPVIGVRDGYTKYQIQEGVTGVTFDPGVEGLVDAIERFRQDGVAADAASLREHAKGYGVDRFRSEMQRVVTDAVASAAIEVAPDLRSPPATDSETTTNE
jgi:glycosyltransferase involved in cell wall biosynthesis